MANAPKILAFSGSARAESLNQKLLDATVEAVRAAGAEVIGAGSIIGSNLTIGRWAMIGMGSVVTKSVPDFHLVIGNPARSVGAVCICGKLLFMFADLTMETKLVSCSACASTYQRTGPLVEKTNGSERNFSPAGRT